MEHLRDEQTNSTFPDKVRLYCKVPEDLDRRGRNLKDFVELPRKLGWTFREDGERNPNNTTHTLNQVTQRWLYFEVLAQTFGHLRDYDAGDFVKKDAFDRVHITTQKLPKYLKNWLVSEEESQATERKRRLVRIQQVLDKARAYVSKYCTVQKLGDNPKWEINSLLALSFLVLGETLTRAQYRIQRKVGFRINGWCSHDLRNQGWGYSKTLLEKLKLDGWCTKAVHMLRALLRGNTIGLIYLFTIRDSKGENHGECTTTKCHAIKVVQPPRYHHCSEESIKLSFGKQKDYGRPAQTRKNPSCTTVEDFEGYVEGKQLATIIDKGYIPLFAFHKDQRRLELVEMSPEFNKSYAIFSHVWTDGFGSLDDRNGINLCVLDIFSDMLEEIAIHRTGQSLEVQDFFWIDTLAIPVGKQFLTQRAKAISQMHNLYTHAKYTIVLDLSLMQVNSGSGYSDNAMKITMSKWMTRLWTLQEAVLSKDLYFCFNDRVYSMKQLEELFDQEDSELHSCVPSLSRIYFHGILGEMRSKIQKGFWGAEGWKPSSNDLAAVWKAAQWRSTAHPIHEFLALAIMLNVDTECFTRPTRGEENSEEYQQDCDDRMIELLYRFGASSPCSIPPGFIFLPGPRLSKKGYGWAPRTWLSSREIDPPDPLSLPDEGNTRLTPEGLEVQYPGFMLHDLGDVIKELSIRADFYFSANSVLSAWYHVEHAEDTVEPAEDPKLFPKAEGLRGRDLAIIVPRLPVLDLKETALLVGVQRTYGEIHYVEILNRVWISQEESQDEVGTLSERHREGRPEAMFAGEQLPPNSKWCVDGPFQPSEKIQLSETNREVKQRPEDPDEQEIKSSNKNHQRSSTWGGGFMSGRGLPWGKSKKDSTTGDGAVGD